MRKVVLALGLLVCALLAPAQAQEWYRMASPEGRFSALFPAQPSYQATPLSGGKLTLHEWISEGEQAAYFASYIDYEPGSILRKGMHSQLDAMAKGLLNGRTLLSEKHLTLDGRACHELFVRDKDGFEIRQRHMVVGDRGYIWNFTSKAALHFRPDAQRFLDSIKVDR